MVRITIAISKQIIEIPHPMYDTIDKAVLSAVSYIKIIKTNMAEKSAYTAIVPYHLILQIHQPIQQNRLNENCGIQCVHHGSSVVLLYQCYPSHQCHCNRISLLLVCIYRGNHTYPSCSKSKFQNAHLVMFDTFSG